MQSKSLFKNDVTPLLKLAIPLVLTGVVQSSLGFFENIFLSRLGETTLAAGGIVNWLFATLIVILFGTFSSTNILIAHKHGASDREGIGQVFRDSLLLAVLLLIPTFLLFWYIAPILSFLGQNATLVALTETYLHALAWGLFPKFILIVLFELLLGLGHSRAIMLITLVSIPLYILFSFVLIFGKFGLPALGIAGAGWGMTFADWIMAVSLFILLFFSKRYHAYFQAIFNWKKPVYLWEILHLGVPIGIMYCLEVGYFFAITLIMGTISIPALAANQIAMQYLGPLMGVIFSIAQAITVRMGHQLGANHPDMAKRSAFVGVGLSAIFMLLIAIFYWLTPHMLISVDFDVSNPTYVETIRLATQLLFIAAFFQILECMRIALFGALRALKDTQFTLLTSTISFWCIALPCGYLLASYLHLAGAGYWYGMIIGGGFNMILLYGRFLKKIKQVEMKR